MTTMLRETARPSSLTIVSITSLLLLLLLSGWSMWIRRHRRKQQPKSTACQEPIPTKSNNDQRSNQHHQDRLERKQAFVSRAGYEYGYCGSTKGFIDAWRSREFPGLIAPLNSTGVNPVVARGRGDHHHALDHSPNAQSNQKGEEKEVYVDYAGSALASRSQLEAILQASITHVLANPHSTGPAAARTMRLMEQAKKRVLDHFYGHGHVRNTIRHSGYDVLFTSGASESLRIVAEQFPWYQACRKCKDRDDNDDKRRRLQSLFVYSQKAHTSVVGMRGPAVASGARFICLASNECPVETLADHLRQMDDYSNCCSHCRDDRRHPIQHLVVLTPECNFGGERLSDVDCVVQRLRALSSIRHRITILLDVSKAASTGPVNLCQLDADLACVSFYKLFGEPTGVGCLFSKQSSVASIFSGQETLAAHGDEGRVRRYFGGGSVDIAIPTEDYAVLRSEPSSIASLNHGTCNFRGIISLIHGFDELDRLGGMECIRRHALSLTSELVRQLQELKHENGSPVVILYGAWKEYDPHHEKEHCHVQPGPTVAFNITRNDGSYVGYNEVSKLAALNRPPIQLRTGCFCNPGACQEALQQSSAELRQNYEQMGHVCGDQVDLIDGRPTGAVRVSVGKDSIWEDVDAVVSFIKRMFAETGNDSGGKTKKWDGRPTEVVLSELFVFPIKSCAAQRVRRWEMVGGGRLLYDREFTLVDSSGTAMRLQSYPDMAFLQPTLDLDSMTMRVSAPGREDLVIDLKITTSNDDATYSDASSVKVCGNKCGGKVWGDVAVSDWFSDYLGVRCWLARYMGSDSDALSDQATSSGRYIRSPDVAFANEQPLLLISEHAVARLNTVLASNGDGLVTSRHFRPNFVIRRAHETEEQCHDDDDDDNDSWERVSLVDKRVEFTGMGPCARCSMVDVDPSSGMKGNTLRAMASYRREKGQITFGIFLRAARAMNSDSGNWTTRNGNDDDAAVRIAEGDRMLCS